MESRERRAGPGFGDQSDTGGGAADSDQLVGALIITVAVIAMGEVVRSARYINLALGAWVVTAALVLDGRVFLETALLVATGLAVMGLSWPRGSVKQHYGGWDRRIA